MAILNLPKAVQNSVRLPKKNLAIIDEASINNSIWTCETVGTDELSSLIDNRRLSPGHLGIIQHLETGDLTFFVTRRRSGSLSSVDTLMNLDLTNISSLNQLPGFEAMYQPVKNLVSRVKGC
jgi:hypothetical protein